MSGTHGIGDVDWEKYNHQALWDMIESADPLEMHTRAATLEALANNLNENADTAYKLMQSILANWGGPTADQAAKVGQPLLDWAARSATTATEVAHRLGVYARAVNKAKLNMPAPVDYQQLNTVADGGTATLGPLDMNAPELTAMANGKTGTPEEAAAAKAKAVEVMREFERDANEAYHGMPTFPKPPKVGSFPTTPPTEPPIRILPIGPGRPVPIPHPPTKQPVEPPTGTPTPVSPDPTTTPTATTTTSGFLDGAGLGTDLPDAGGSGALGAGAGAGVALPGTGSGSGGVIGVLGAGARSGAAADEEAAASRAAGMAAEEAEQGAWGGFAPPMGAGTGDRDAKHRNQYAEDPDLVGELPPAFPPVLGL